MFYASDWVIERNGIKDIEKLFDAAADLDCVLWVNTFSTEESFRAARFVVRIPSFAIFEAFKKKNVHLPFKNWQAVELEPSKILPLDKPVRISQWSGHNKSTFMGGFFEAAVQNEEVINQENES